MKSLAAAFARSSGSPSMLPETSIASTTLSFRLASCADSTPVTGTAVSPSNAWNCLMVRPCTGTPRGSSAVTTAWTSG